MAGLTVPFCSTQTCPSYYIWKLKNNVESESPLKTENLNQQKLPFGDSMLVWVDTIRSRCANTN